MTAPESLADQLLAATINCPHVIDSDRIVLHFDRSKPGHNALNQLSRRLAALASSAPAVAAVGQQPDLSEKISAAIRTITSCPDITKGGLSLKKELLAALSSPAPAAGADQEPVQPDAPTFRSRLADRCARQKCHGETFSDQTLMEGNKG